MEIKFLNEEQKYEAQFKIINEHVVEIKGLSQNLSGFELYYNDNLLGSYHDYTTLYRQLDDGYQLSNNDDVWKEVIIPDTPIPPLEPTELEKLKKQQELTDQAVQDLILMMIGGGE